MFHKDTVRLIRKTLNRFISLLMIVLIGSAFMMGLLSTRTIMEDNVDRYADAQALQDIQFYSSYGFCDEDIEALKELDCVDEVFASRFRDVYSLSSAGNVSVTRVEEAERDLDRFELLDGRMPEAPGEALVLDSGMTKGEYRIGEHLSLFLEDEDIDELLSETEYTVVGIVKTPSYMAKTLGTGTLKNQDLSMVIYVPAENFISEYYTTVYATVKGAKDLEAFGREYKAFIAEAKDDIDGFAKKQQDYLKDTLLQEYKDKIAEGEAELEEKRAEGQQKLDDAKKQLDDANIQIISGEAQISTLEGALNALLARQRALEKQYGDNYTASTERIAQIEKDSGRSFEDYYSAMLADYGTYTAMGRLIEEADSALIRDQLERSRAELDARYEGGIEAAYEEINQLSRDRLYYEALTEEIRVAKEAEQQARSEISSMRYRVRKGREEYEKGLEEYNKGLIEFNTEIEKAELDIRKAYQELEELPDAEWMVLDRESHYSTYMYENNTKQMGAIGVSLPFLFFLVAALVCLTTMTRLVDEQRGQIGIFRALGFSKGQIVWKYVGYALLASFIGSLIGLFVGMAIFPVVIYETWRLMYDLPTLVMHMPLHYAVISVLSFAVLIAAVTAYVVNKTLKEMPSQLMRPKPPRNAKKVFLEKVPFIWNRLTFTFRITARNLIRYRARALMTIIGVAGCTGLLVLGWGIKDSIADIVAIQFGELYNYDYTVNMDSDANIDEIIKTLEKDDSNENVAPYMTYASKVYVNGKEPTINVVVLDAREGNDMLHFRETDKSTPVRIKSSGVIVNEKFARNNGIKEGDTLIIESASGIKKEVKVNVIYELYFQHYMYMSEDYYDTVFDEPVHYNSIAIRNAEKTADEISSEISRTEGYGSIMDFTGLTRQFNIMIEALDFIILVIIVTAGSLAFVVLLNLTQVNISERIREIATLKVLGFHNTEVNTYIFKEIFLLSLFGAIIGLPLGVLEHHFIMNVINMEMIMFGDRIKLPSFALAFAVTIVFTLIVLLLTRRPLKKVQMVESLKSVE